MADDQNAPPKKFSAETLFVDAVELPDAAEREKFISAQCGSNASLRKEVEQLVEDYFAAGSLLEQSPALGSISSEGDTGDQTVDLVPTVIGNYTIREQIGEGGMGTVYVAEQKKPVRRKVALKIIRAGMTSKEIVARFEVERQALAMMNHPNIARVIDGGTTPTGQPFFAMELVQGLPITEYADSYRLSIDERLAMFAKVCLAVQHAHRKGVIHRDLKPSNVLVARIDDQAVPKVIDFGLAKAVSQPLTDETVYTGFTRMIGTPLYMSPEQAEMGVTDVDTRCDVYALGVMLYELLTGDPPFSRESFKSASFDEVRRIIREVEPNRPSIAVTTQLAARQTTIAAQRHVELRKLRDSLQGELDWIVMKAMEKDRSRRYESASALAADVERYLVGDVVQACPPSITYRFSKVVRQNRILLTTSALIALALIVGTGVSLLQAFEARKARDLASQRLAAEKIARIEANSNLVLANEAAAREQTERRKSEENFRMAREAVDKYFVQISENTLLDKPGMRPLRMELLTFAEEYYQNFVEQQGDNTPELQADLGRTYYRIGGILYELGRRGEAIHSLGQALAIQRQLAMTRSDDTFNQETAVIETLNRLATVHDAEGDLDRAVAYLDESESLIQAMDGSQTPQQQIVQARLLSIRGRVLNKMNGRSAQALAAKIRAREICESVLESGLVMSEEIRKEYLELSSILVNNLALEEPNSNERLRLFTEAIDLQKQLLDHSNSQQNRYMLSVMFSNRSNVFGDLGDFDSALQSSELAIQQQTILAHENPSVPEYQYRLRSLYRQRQEIQEDRGEIVARETRFTDSIGIERAQALLDALCENPAEEMDGRLKLAWGLVKAAHEQWREAELDKSLLTIELADKALMPIIGRDFDQNTFALLQHCQGMVAYVRGCVANVQSNGHINTDGHLRDAIKAFTRGVHSGSLEEKLQADVFCIRSRCHQLLGEDDEAISDLNAAIREEPEDLDTRRLLDGILRTSRRIEDRLPNLTEMIRLTDEKQKRALIDARGASLLRLGRFEEAVLDLDQTFELEGSIASHRWFYTALVLCHFRLGNDSRVRELFDPTIEEISSQGELSGTVAKIFMQLREDEKAEALLDKATAKVNAPHELFHLVDAYERLGNKQQSQAAFDKIVAWNNRDHNYYRVVGMAHFSRGEYDLALSALDRSVETSPPLSRFASLGARSSCLLRMGRIGEALADAKESCRGDEVSLQLGQALVAVGQFESAMRVSERIEPRKFALSLRAQALEGLGQMEESLADYFTSNVLPFFDSTSWKGRDWTRRALLLDQLGRYREALAEYEMIDALMRVTPHRYDVEYNALVQFVWFLVNCPETELRNANRAMGLSLGFAEAYPKNVEFQNAIAACYYRLGDGDAALRQIEEADKLFSGGADPFLHAMILWRNGRQSEAREAYTLGQARVVDTEKPPRFQAEAANLLGIGPESQASVRLEIRD